MTHGVSAWCRLGLSVFRLSPILLLSWCPVPFRNVNQYTMGNSHQRTGVKQIEEKAQISRVSPEIQLLCEVMPNVLLEIIIAYLTLPTFTKTREVKWKSMQPLTNVQSILLFGHGILVVVESWTLITFAMNGTELARRSLTDFLDKEANRVCLGAGGIFIEEEEPEESEIQESDFFSLNYFAISHNGSISEEVQVFDPVLPEETTVDDFAATNNHIILVINNEEGQDTISIFPLSFKRQCSSICSMKIAAWSLVASGGDFAFFTGVKERWRREVWTFEHGKFVQRYAVDNGREASEIQIFSGLLYEFRPDTGLVRVYQDGEEEVVFASPSLLRADSASMHITMCDEHCGLFDFIRTRFCCLSKARS